MAAVRSALYICGFGALGYGLMTILTPNESDLNKKLLEGRSGATNELQKKRQTFVDVLKSAANEKEPIYRQKKEEIDKNLRK